MRWQGREKQTRNESSSLGSECRKGHFERLDWTVNNLMTFVVVYHEHIMPWAGRCARE